MKGLIFFLSMLLVSGCGILGDKKISVRSPAPLVDFKPAIELKLLWQAQLGSGGMFALQPAVNANYVVAAAADGTVSAFELATGRLFWRVSVGFPLTAGVALSESSVVVGGGEGDVAVLSMTDGTVRWKTRVDAEIFDTPIFVQDVIVVRSSDARLFGLGVEDGRSLWVVQRVLPPLVMRAETSMVATGGVIYAGTPSGRLIAVTARNGNVVFDVPIAQPRGTTELERMVDITGTLALDAGQVCAAAYQGKVACLNAQNGTVQWARDFSSAAGVALDGRYLFAVSARGDVQALTRRDGTPTWTHTQLHNRLPTAPVPWGRAVVVGDFQGQVHFLAREEGTLLARVATDGSAIRAVPLALENEKINAVLIQTSGGGLYAITHR